MENNTAIEDAELEKAADNAAKNAGYHSATYVAYKSLFKQGAKWAALQPKEAIDYLVFLQIRNKIVDLMPIGDVSAFDIIKAIKEYLKWFDEFAAQPKEVEQNEWISVEDAEPELGQGVLMYINTGLITVGYRRPNDWQLFGDINISLVIDLTKDFITHWQPLPLPPTKQKQ